MTVWQIVLTVVLSAAAMEAVAWSAPPLHHARPRLGLAPRPPRAARRHAGKETTCFAVVGTVSALALFTAGWWWEPLWWVAVGVTVYGAIYTLIHDGLVHQRYWRWTPRRGYAKRLVQGAQAAPCDRGQEGWGSASASCWRETRPD